MIKEPENILKWNSINLTHTPSEKAILQDITGHVQSGQLFTIMGQSGAGKSSFLSILTGRITNRTKDFSLKGNVTINNVSYDAYSFGKFAAYVRQHDILMTTLTVQETFQFQSELKLCNMTEEERKFEITKLMKKLELYQCRQVLVGGEFSKTISGGQRKRVAIGVQLLSDPICLILDQPTSGLDSSISLTLLKLLKRLANEGKIIMATIHQPSTLMFNELENLLLLSKGQIAYQGPSKQIVKYMTKIGIKVNKRMNPADFFMLQISAYKRQKGYNTPMTAQNFKRFHQIQEKVLKGKNNLPQNPSAKPNCFLQMKHLMKRAFKNFYRTPSNQSGKVICLFLVPFLISTLYYNIGGKAVEFGPTEQFLQFIRDYTACMFLSVFFTFAMNIYDTVLVFPTQKELALKQSSSGLYSLSVYFLSRMLIQLPLSILTALTSGTIIYFALSLEPDFPHYAFFVGMYILMAVTGYAAGLFIGVVFSTGQLAIQILPIIMIPMLLFGGLVVNLNDIPAYSSWMQYISPLRHGYSSLMLNTLNTDKLKHLADHQQVLDMAGVNGSQGLNIVFLSLIFASTILLTLVVLKIKKKPI